MGANSKFNQEEVDEIKRLYYHGTPKPWTVRNLAHIFNVSEATIYKVINDKYKVKGR